jgi:hypothetical protein
MNNAHLLGGTSESDSATDSAPEIPQIPQPVTRVERTQEVRRCGFLFLTKKTKTIEVTYTYTPKPKQVGESKAPLQIDESIESSVNSWLRH